MSAEGPLTVGLIGAGYFAGFHAEAWGRMADARLAAVVDLALEKARAAAARAAQETAPALFDDAARMLRETAPDIVDIAAPPTAHAALIDAALAARPAAIICQKPFCGDLAAAREATARAEAAGVPLVVHENFRFQPWYRAMRSALDAGVIGAPYQVAFRLRPGDGQGPDAYRARQPYFQEMPRFLVHETGVHWIDTFRFLFGEPDRVYADLRRLNPAIAGEDAGHILFSYRDGRRALFDGNRLADHAAEDHRRTMGECLIEGSEGALAFGGDGAVLLRAKGDRDWREIAPAPPPSAGFGGDCVFALQAHVVAHLRSGAPLENAARAYLRVMEIEEAAYRSADTGCAVDLAERWQ